MNASWDRSPLASNPPGREDCRVTRISTRTGAADPRTFPTLVRPMLAVPGTIDEVSGPGWAYEMKWDGIRLIAYIRDGGVRLLSRNDRDVTATYPELHGLAEVVDSVVLDGEVVALDQQGRPSFGRLQQRMGLTRPAQVE